VVVDGLPTGVTVFVGGAGAESRPDDLRRAGATLVPSFQALETVYQDLGARL
jgi:hypothetical protein